ncbi:N-acetylmuramoyl-L-alanine amidase [Candidatus Sulfidibacterium hydrothermale]|uniref:N-acetylmuramoyl-L-alanine amidase family protein n=1 Tax=Candidatus Sulfidibacterium hydrothermale TaxID=2875962 RepID=UPI001F0B1E91|nr:N-acetylmuramoyl-L-alanine amidase [Candidatus Sulfidibacterium hydrothermale]UBM62370.1 N-acetylmuramoyl-L-alanine amidase [Candidatus Sulfidibacterium hydrothermale]
MTIFANIGSILKQGLIKRGLFLWIVLSMVFYSGSPVFAQRGVKISTVVIDAGHGGKDPGASGKHTKEKNVTLAIALKLGYYIHHYMPDVRVIYTRKTDRFIPLYKRAEIANKNHADIFISIHCNSNLSSRPYGAETYVLGLHKNEANLEVAQKENASILYEDNPKEYDGFDNSPESYISLSLFQSPYLKESLDLANKIEQQMRAVAGRKARGVFQAGFLVLWRTTMPSVLIETGFLSNPKEEAFLASSKGQTKIAYAIYRAFKAYKTEFERENAVHHPTTSVSHQSAGKGTSGTRVEYRVQFYTSSRAVPVSSSRFRGISSVTYYKQNGLYKYTAGHFSSLSQAVSYQYALRKKGFKDAFVVAFSQNRRISLSQAKKLKKK